MAAPVSNTQPLARRQKFLNVTTPNTHMVGVRAVLWVIFMIFLLSSMLPLMGMCDILIKVFFFFFKKDIVASKMQKQHIPFLSWPGIAWMRRIQVVKPGEGLREAWAQNGTE